MYSSPFEGIKLKNKKPPSNLQMYSSPFEGIK
jgi:hypothetical protein